jgi:hypothetical protein
MVAQLVVSLRNKWCESYHIGAGQPVRTDIVRHVAWHNVIIMKY